MCTNICSGGLQSNRKSEVVVGGLWVYNTLGFLSKFFFFLIVMCVHILFCLFFVLLGALINLPLLVVFFVVLFVGVHFFCVIEYIFIIVFVCYWIVYFSCVFSWCRLFLFMISPRSVFTKYYLGCWIFFQNYTFFFHCSWDSMLTLSFGFNIGNSPLFLLLFVCFFKYISSFMLVWFVRTIFLIICWADDGVPSFKSVVLSYNRAKYGSCLLSYAFVSVF